MAPALSAAMTMPSLIFTETMMVTAQLPFPASPSSVWREAAAPHIRLRSGPLRGVYRRPGTQPVALAVSHATAAATASMATPAASPAQSRTPSSSR